MENSLNIAMFLFLYLLAAGVALLVNTNYILQAINDLINNKGLMLITGFMALMFGAFVISFHGFYKFEWPLLITIIGWLSFIKGILYLVSDKLIKKVSNFYQSEKTVQIHAVIVLLLAAYFGYQVFCCAN